MSDLTPADIDRIIEELELTNDDIEKLLNMKSTYRNYCKQMIRDLKKVQFDYLNTVVQFDEEINTTSQKKSILIS